jgi:hypothetical protein
VQSRGSLGMAVQEGGPERIEAQAALIEPDRFRTASFVALPNISAPETAILAWWMNAVAISRHGNVGHEYMPNYR